MRSKASAAHAARACAWRRPPALARCLATASISAVRRLPVASIARARSLAIASIGVAALSSLGGCSVWRDGPAYYWQSIAGHLAVMREAQPIAPMLENAAIEPRLHERLREVLEIRRFASDELGLPRNDSYTEYADIGRPFVVWNVFATPELSMRLEQWCFPIAGCVSYRGYYDREQAERYARRLREDGLDVVVRGVAAYSTLGWFDDPVLNTFIRYPEGEIARLIFHELAHQVLYVKGDTTFNESFATAVEQVGVERWLAAHEAKTGDRTARAAWQAFASRRADFLALLRRHRAALEALYATTLPEDEKREAKRAVFARLRSDYEALKKDWGGFTGYDNWFAQPLTNAHLASIASYTERVPAFRALLAREGGDLPSFYRAARRIGEMPPGERNAALDALSGLPNPS